MAVWIYCLFCQITVIIDFAGGHQIIRYRHYSLLQFDLRGQAVRDELDRFIVIQPLHFVQLRPPTFIIQLGSVRQSLWPSVWLPGCETEQDKSGSKWWQRKISMKNKEKFMLFMSMDGRNQSTKTERSEAACKTLKKKKKHPWHWRNFKLRCSFSSDCSCTFGDTIINKNYILS